MLRLWLRASDVQLHVTQDPWVDSQSPVHEGHAWHGSKAWKPSWTGM